MPIEIDERCLFSSCSSVASLVVGFLYTPSSLAIDYSGNLLIEFSHTNAKVAAVIGGVLSLVITGRSLSKQVSLKEIQASHIVHMFSTAACDSIVCVAFVIMGVCQQGFYSMCTNPAGLVLVNTTPLWHYADVIVPTLSLCILQYLAYKTRPLTTESAAVETRGI